MSDTAPMLFDVRLGGLFPANRVAEEAMQECVKKLVDYEPRTGILTWRERTPSMFKTSKQTAEHNCAIWNGKFAGTPALNSRDKHGYRTGHFLSIPFKAHRLIWFMEYGAWPAEIDHINGNKGDNRLINLRAVDHATNGRNLRLKKNNTSGHTGVFRQRSGRWAAYYTFKNKKVTVGTFDTADQAVSARKNAIRGLGFHANHGVKR